MPLAIIYSIVLSLISLIFTFRAAIYFAPPLFRTDEKIKDMSATIPDGNPTMETELKNDRSNSRKGFLCLCLGFAFQTLSFIAQLV